MTFDPTPERLLRTGFSSQLSRFDGEVDDLFTAVTCAVQRATAALVSGDDSEAARMTARVERSRSILAATEQDLDLTFALQAPVATDQRRMLTALRVMPPLVRCLELARHIAERAKFAGEFPPDVCSSFREMGALATALWEKSSTAWHSRRPSLALELDEDDDELDVLCNEVAERLCQMEGNLLLAMEARLIVRFYERLGDHAVHVSQRISYLATGNEPAPG